jgi:hypothetical protein
MSTYHVQLIYVEPIAIELGNVMIQVGDEPVIDDVIFAVVYIDSFNDTPIR